MSDQNTQVLGGNAGKLLRGFLKGGERRKLNSGLLLSIVTPYAAVIAVYAIWASSIGVLDPLELTAIFYSAMLVIVFLITGSSAEAAKRGPTPIDYLLSGLSFFIGLYLLINADRFITRVSLLDPLNSLDTFLGVMIFILTLEATRRTVGMGLTAVVGTFVLYAFFGHLLPGQLWHRQVSLYHFLDQNVFSTNGIFGLPTRVAVTYAFLFVMFGSFLQKAGGGDFFFDVAAAITGKAKGGPAKIAVVSSALFGMLSGSPTSDVVTTGSITIPMMKRTGYSSVFAGAVETAASTGGSILPPIMGSAVFIMAEITSIPYASIAMASVLSALLYYEAIYLQVHFRAINIGLASIPDEQIPTMVTALRRGGLYMIPLLVLIWFLAEGYTASYVAIMGTASVVVVSWLRKSTRMGLKDVFDCLATTTMRVVPVTAACAAAGLVVGLISMTGLAGKFVRLLFSVSGGDLFISLVMAAAVCIILGMGMPTPSAYVLGAVLVAPALLDLGVPLMSAHLFIVYFAVMSAVTPPVAVAAYAAASLADANPFEIAVQAVRLSIIAFIIPFMFVYEPALLLEKGLLAGMLAFGTACIGVVGLAGGIEKRLLLPLNWRMRLLAIVGGLTMIYPGYVSDIIGLVIIGGIYLIQLPKARELAFSQKQIQKGSSETA